MQFKTEISPKRANRRIWLKKKTAKNRVPDPKLIISDPDPHIENQEFLIRILLWTSDGEIFFSILGNNKTQMGWNLQLFELFKNCIWNSDKFFHFLVHF